jgi:hypothetical protein
MKPSTLQVLPLAMRLMGAVGVVSALAIPAVSVAADGAEAEKVRLEGEMKKLAAKNAWAGVERNYLALQDLKVTLNFDDHFLGAQSARSLGKTWEMYNRLEAAKKLSPKAEITSEMEGIESQYSRVQFDGNPKRIPYLKPVVMPFAPDQRKSIEYAQTVLQNTGSFKGMLPFGDYELGSDAEVSKSCAKVTLAEGKKDFTVVDVRKCGQRGETIEYAGPVVLAGYNFMNSAAPAESNDVNPIITAASGISVEGGGEVGFSKSFGVAATVGYRGGYGDGVFHNVNGWIAAAIRPGNLRVVVGPTYGVTFGSGRGIANEINGLDTTRFQLSSLEYKGYATSLGGRLGVGYGLIELGPLHGLIEAYGGFEHDGTRGYVNAGLRIGIVPKIERFKG